MIVLNNFVFVMLCLFCYVIDIVGSKSYFDFSQLLDFVFFFNNQCIDFIGVFVDFGGDFV